MQSIAANRLAAQLESNRERCIQGCSGLISMTIPDSLVVYKTSSGCSALQELSVSPLNTTFSSIDGVLYNKDASILIHYPEGKTAEEFTFPSSVRKIGVAAFQNCLLDSIIIPVSVEELGEQVFRGSRLKKIVISDGVYTIPEAAFKECAELKELVLGKEISALFDYCLDGCNLQELYLMATYPPVCYSSTLPGQGIFSMYVLFTCLPDVNRFTGRRKDGETSCGLMNSDGFIGPLFGWLQRFVRFQILIHSLDV